MLQCIDAIFAAEDATNGNDVVEDRACGLECTVAEQSWNANP